MSSDCVHTAGLPTTFSLHLAVSTSSSAPLGVAHRGNPATTRTCRGSS
jgi:hypothetical protein